MTTTDTPTAAPPKELYRTRDDRMLAGVAGGLGRYFDLSPNFFRVGFAILTLVGGAGFLIYLAAALVIPAEGDEDSIVAEALRRHRDRPWLLIGVALVSVAFVSLLADARFWPNSDFAWMLIVAGVLAIVLAQRQRGSRGEAEAGAAASASPAAPSLFVPVLGLLLAGIGALALLSAVGVGIRWDIAFAAAALAVGVVVAVGAIARRRTGGLLFVGLLLGVVALVLSASNIRLEGPVGERVYQPLASSSVARTYEMAVGDLEVDLSRTAFASGDTEVTIELGVGEALVIVPRHVAVDIEASASVGQVHVFNRHSGGFGASLATTEGGSRSTGDKLLRIDAHVGLGDLRIVRGR